MRCLDRTGRGLFLVCCLFMAVRSDTGAEGLQLQLRLEYASTLQYEPIMAFLTVNNDTAKPFVISETGQQSAATLEFVIRKDTGETIGRRSKALVAEKVYIPSDQKEELMIEVTDFYDLREVGRYLVSARVTWEGKPYGSEQRMIDVVSGLDCGSASKSVPGYPDRVRNYTLKYWARNSKEYLFLVVDEEASKLNYGVYQLGSIVRVFKPVIDVDRAGNIHIIHQYGEDCYVHSFFKSTRDGVRFIDHSYRRENGELYRPESPAVKPKSEPPAKSGGK